MRIVLWSDPFWPSIGGVERLVVPLVRALSDRGHDVLVITNQRKAESAPELDLGTARVVRLDMVGALDRRDPAEILGIQSQVARAIREFEPQVVHLFAAMLSAYFYARIARRIRCPILYTEQTGWFRLESPNSLQRQVMESADWFATCSHASARSIGELFPAIGPRMTVIVNGIDLPPAPGDGPPPLDPPILLGLGRHHLDQKGFDVAVAAMPAILARRPDARLVLAGDGPDRERLEGQVVASGLPEHVQFPGWVHPERVHETIGQSTMMLVPSRFDPFGLVAAETGAAGRACVASAVGGLAEIVVDGETGRLVPPDDPPALAAAVLGLLEDPVALVAMGRAARQRVERCFRFDRFVDESEALYATLIESIPRRDHDR